MRTEKDAILSLEVGLLGKWQREDKQFFMYFHATPLAGEIGLVNCSTQEIVLEITPPFEYQVALTDFDEAKGWQCWLHIIDKEKDKTDKYRLWFLDSAMGKFELMNEKGEKVYFEKPTYQTNERLHL